MFAPLLALGLPVLILLAGCEQSPDPARSAADDVAPAAPRAGMSPELARQLSSGAVVFARTCASCHGDDGAGLPGVFPPLARSRRIAEHPERSIGIVLRGLRGRIVVNGVAYDSTMPPMNQLADAEVADVLTYAMNAWDGPGGRVRAADVAVVRAAGPQ